MSCPTNPSELTLLKSVLKEHHVKETDYKIIVKGITKIFEDEKEKVDGGSESAEEKARRKASKCSTAGMVVIVLIALSMTGATVYTAQCYAPTQFGRLIKATNDQIRNTIEVILDTGFLSISLDDPEFIKECIEWLKKAALLYLGNKIVSGTDRVMKLAKQVCKALGLSYRSETSSERRRKSRTAKRTSRHDARKSQKFKNDIQGTLRQRRRSQTHISSSDSRSDDSRPAIKVSASDNKTFARKTPGTRDVSQPRFITPKPSGILRKSSSSESDVSSESIEANPFHPKNTTVK